MKKGSKVSGRKDDTFAFRLAPDEKKAFRAAAARVGMRTGTWARAVLRREAGLPAFGITPPSSGSK